MMYHLLASMNLHETCSLNPHIPSQYVGVTTVFHTKGIFCNICDTIPAYDITITLLSLCTP